MKIINLDKNNINGEQAYKINSNDIVDESNEIFFSRREDRFGLQELIQKHFNGEYPYYRIVTAFNDVRYLEALDDSLETKRRLRINQ